MHFEAALNLLWVSLGLVALATAARALLNRRRLIPVDGAARNASPACAPVWLHIVGVCLTVSVLFPYISATDDMVRFEHFSAQVSHQHTNLPSNNSQTENLIHLYKVMDASLVCTVREISLVFFFVCLVFTPVARPLERIQPREAGRSPPVFV